MPSFEDSTDHRATQRVKALLRRGTRILPWIRRELRDTRQKFGDARQELQRANRRLARHQEEIDALRLRLARREAGGEDGNIKPENIVWVFGSGRTGSSWLAFMMGSLPEHSRWNEPLVGYLFGHTYYERAGHRKDDPTDRHFILGGDRRTWLTSVRDLVLDGATARFPQRAQSGYLVIKEPHGSIGAPLC